MIRPGRATRERTTARTAARAKDWATAATAYGRHLARHPDDVAARIQLGHALAEQGELDDAEAAYREAARRAPTCADAHRQLAALELRRGRPAHALPALLSTAVLDPGDRETGDRLQQQVGDLVLLEAHLLATALALKPDDRALATILSPIWRYPARRHARKRRWQKAAAWYQTAARHGWWTAASFVQLGHAYKELGRFEEAEHAYRRGVALAPRAADPRFQLGRLFRLNGDLRRARQSLLIAWTLQPGRPAIAEELDSMEVSAAERSQLAAQVWLMQPSDGDLSGGDQALSSSLLPLLPTAPVHLSPAGRRIFMSLTRAAVRAHGAVQDS